MLDPDLMRLLAPLDDDDVLPHGVAIVHAAWDDDRAQATVRLVEPALELRLRPRGDGAALARSARFDLTVAPGVQHTEASRRALRTVVRRLVAHDTEPLPDEPPRAPVPQAPPGPGVLHLVPGHVGVATDLTVRAVRVLGRVAALVTEDGDSAPLRQLLADHRVLHEARPVLRATSAADAQTVLDLLRAGEDVALFGFDEGIPTFADPGSSLVARVTEELGDGQVRTVGGSSVLGLALMRVPEALERFVFLGVADGGAGLDAVKLAGLAREVRGELDRARWVVVFATVASARALAAALVPERLELLLAVALTRPDEAVLRATTGADAPEPFAEAAADAPGVLFLRRAGA
ncbi:MAG: hypothetical protein H6732_17100 [Alphaproteobacteria bacterium]|nr:hypothetical protein [Alphaproteobacteria bacterium]